MQGYYTVSKLLWNEWEEPLLSYYHGCSTKEILAIGMFPPKSMFHLQQKTWSNIDKDWTVLCQEKKILSQLNSNTSQTRLTVMDENFHRGALRYWVGL